MSETADSEVVEAPARKFPIALVLSGFLAAMGGALGFVAVQNGMIPMAKTQDASAKTTVGDLHKLGFVPLEPIVVTLGHGTSKTHLRFRAELEVTSETSSEVEALRPRLIDVMNVYLRALKAEDLDDPLALHRLRAQVLRRMQLVAGPDRVRDVLIMEFVLN